MNRKPTPEEMGQNLEEFADKHELLQEAERLGTRTKAEVLASLASSPHDQERAKEMGRRAAEAFAKGQRGPESQGFVKPVTAVLAIEPPSRPGVRWMLPLGLAAGFALTVAFEGPAILAWIEGPVNPKMQDAGPPHRKAEELVAQAREDCKSARWSDCILKISNATSLEPALSSNPEVTEMRRMAEEKLLEESTPKVDAGPKVPK
jgi:hypothetical protein